MSCAITSPHKVIDLSLDSNNEEPRARYDNTKFPNLSDSLDEIDDFLSEPARKRQRINTTHDIQLEKSCDPATQQLNGSKSVDTSLGSIFRDNLDDISSSPPLSSLLATVSHARTSEEHGQRPSAKQASGSAKDTQNLSATTAALLADILNVPDVSDRAVVSKTNRFKTLSTTSKNRGQRDSTPVTVSRKVGSAASGDGQNCEDINAKRRMKESEAERKRITREEKALERQRAADFTRANQARQRDKKSSSANMIVEIPPSLSNHPMISNASAKLRELHAEVKTFEQPLENVITWRRKVSSRFNEEIGHWELIEAEIIKEQHALCYFAGEDMCRMLLNGTESGELDRYLSRVREAYSSYRLLFIFQGVDSALKKFRTSNNRSYRIAVRQGTAMVADAQLQDLNSMVDVVEESLMHLQTVHGGCVLQTTDDAESAEWLVAFSEQISLIPSRIEKDHLEADFCMELGQVNSGDDARDTFVKMLQQVVRVTAPIAYGIAAEYSDVPSLISAFEKQGPLALQDLKKCANSDGAATDARIGPQVSRRLAQIFLEVDPDMVEL